MLPRCAQIVGDHGHIAVVRRRSQSALADRVRRRQIESVGEVKGDWSRRVGGPGTNGRWLQAVVVPLIQVDAAEAARLTQH